VLAVAGTLAGRGGKQALALCFEAKGFRVRIGFSVLTSIRTYISTEQHTFEGRITVVINLAGLPVISRICSIAQRSATGRLFESFGHNAHSTIEEASL
jgi:hypothetical protein